MSAEIFNVVVGTAGHIDHGKSSLVKRLTGIDPDRWAAEQERGITIDLGFASFLLPDGRRVGIVDVPGHEKFVKNMVAGATGIDLVVLVVAADDGVMPQTREHLQIMGMLGLERGLIAMTKIDLDAVDEDYLELQIEDTRDALAGTFMADAPLFPLSSITGEGFDDFVEGLATAVSESPTRDTSGLFRMPIQRVFSARGHGTIVTGIPISGTARKGDALEVQPGGLEGRVRGIQAYGQPAEEARAGHSSALNLADVDYREVKRGMVVSASGYFAPETLFEAELTYTGSVLEDESKPLVHTQPVHFHTGTAEVTGRVYLLEGNTLEAGGTALVQIGLDQAVAAAPGDRFVIRRYSPVITIGGGRLVGVAERRGGRRKDAAERVRQKAGSLGDANAQAQILLEAAGPGGTTEQALTKGLQLLPKEGRDLVAALTESGALIRLSQGGRLVASTTFETFGARLLELLDAWHQANPKKKFCEGIELRNDLRLDPVFFDQLLARLEEAGELKRDRARVRRAGLEVELSPEEQELLQTIVIIYRDAGFKTPRPALVAEQTDTSMDKLKPVLELAVDQGDLMELEENVLLEQSRFVEAVRLVVSSIQRDGHLNTGELRDSLGTTRKYLIPLLDTIDQLGITVRRDSERVLSKDHAKALERQGITL